ncbi:rRNA-processing protein FCF2 [Spathaspora sp. JA1]|nr:rRNA-processing protein FCF2 [Spathaspora sp. JA1]
MSKEPTILESSETESYNSDKCKMLSEATYTDLTLDDLFDNLHQETRVNTVVEQDTFNKIETSIKNLPKIESNLEQTLKQKKDVIRIYDPVAATTTTPKDTTDGRWFNMKQPELTPEINRDLQIIKQRSALDPKRHYKKDNWKIPKYFQMGTIVEGNTEFYTRLNKKQRGNTLVQEILNDDDTKKYFKRKYSEIQSAKASGKKGHYKNVKKARRKF